MISTKELQAIFDRETLYIDSLDESATNTHDRHVTLALLRREINKRLLITGHELIKETL